jgi:hypothetical protein
MWPIMEMGLKMESGKPKALLEKKSNVVPLEISQT